MKRYIVMVVFASLLCASVGRAASDDTWKKALGDSLYPGTPIKLARTSMSMNSIKQPGTVMVMRKEGLSGTKAGEGFAANVVKDGVIVQKGSAFNMVMGGGSNRRDFHVGDKFFITATNMKDKQISFDLVSCSTYDVTTAGTTKSERYAAQLQFEFAEGYLPTASPAKVQETLDAVIINEERMQAAAPATVALNQTFAEVEKALGKPDRVVDLGTKVTWVYKDMKVVFVDGKVADVL
jgi:hypothetical protein